MIKNLSETGEKIILNHINNGTLAHAYLFYGANDTIVSGVINDFLKSLYCKNNKYFCDECDECLKINSNSNVDITNIFPDGNSIKIKQIRDMQYKVNLSSYEYKYNIFILHNADTMTIEASNAFLKTLEEPTKDTIIILASKSKDLLLPTILSRCIHIKVNESETKEDITIEEKEYILENIVNILEGNNLNDVNICKKLVKNKNKVVNYVVFIMKFFSNVLIYKESNLEVSFGENKNYMDYIKSVNKIVTKDRLNKIIEKTLYINEMLNYNANQSLALLNLFIYIKEDK